MTDQMGYVYFGNYPEFYDIGRTELLRSLEMEPAKLEKQGIMLTVRQVDAQYCHPAFYDELITIKSTLIKVTPLQLDFKFEIFNPQGKLLNFGHLTLIFVDKNSRKPRRSNDIIHQLEQKIYKEAENEPHEN